MSANFTSYSSVSSFIITQITYFRNPEKPSSDLKLHKVLLAEAGYLVTIPFSIVESALSSSAVILSSPFIVMGSKKLEKTISWFASSSFSTLWSSTYAIMNLTRRELIKFEGPSVGNLFSGNYIHQPHLMC